TSGYYFLPQELPEHSSGARVLEFSSIPELEGGNPLRDFKSFPWLQLSARKGGCSNEYSFDTFCTGEAMIPDLSDPVRLLAVLRARVGSLTTIRRTQWRGRLHIIMVD